MLSLNKALAILDQIAAACSQQLEREEIQVRDGFNRVLATPQFSRLNLPAFDKAAMDGYAVLAADQIAQKCDYRLIATVVAGEIPQQKLYRGATMKIMTGAPVPEGATVIVPVEMAEEHDARVKILNWPPTSNIYKFGQDVKCGDLILNGGATLNPVAIANLIACGITAVTVYRRLRVVVVSTGEEIVDEFTDIVASKIMNSNGPMLQTLCGKFGLDVIANLKIADDCALTVQVLNDTLSQADIVLFSGGVSVGDCDFVTKALVTSGLTIHFNRLAIKPGKPTTFASNVLQVVDQANNETNAEVKPSGLKLVFGLPGNPVAVYLGFYLFVVRVLQVMFGKKIAKHENYITLPLAQHFKRLQTDRVEYVPCCLQHDGSILPLDFHGSAHLSVLLRCDGFFVVPEGVKELTAGEKVSFLNIDA